MKRSILTALAAITLALTSNANTRRFVVEDMQGTRHDLTEAVENGRQVALVFWQTWCTSCRKEAPDLVKASEDLRGKVDFFGVVSGTDEFVDDSAVSSFVQKEGLPYPQVRDRDLRLTEAFKVTGTPTIIVLGEGHKVLYKGHRLPEHFRP